MCSVNKIRLSYHDTVEKRNLNTFKKAVNWKDYDHPPLTSCPRFNVLDSGLCEISNRTTHFMLYWHKRRMQSEYSHAYFILLLSYSAQTLLVDVCEQSTIYTRR